jgi:hypothetical protein
MITFYYSGPQKPKKDSVKNGYRVKAEAVALGLSKQGNLIVRAWVQPPSVSKKGFAKHGWRTFIIGRMSNVEITDEVFNGKRPEYKEGSDNSMTTTYVTTNWGTTSDTKKVEKPSPTVTKPEPTKPPVSKVSDKPTEVTPTEPVKPEELPQPKPEEKPSELPQGGDNQDYEVKQKELYKTKQTDWINKQKEIGGNIKPGQGTRERFKKEVEKELPQPETEKKPEVNPDEDVEGKNLQESLKRIKRLMFY